MISPYSLDVIEELVVPMDGYLAYWARDYPVHPGDWAFGVIPGGPPGHGVVRADRGDHRALGLNEAPDRGAASRPRLVG